MRDAVRPVLIALALTGGAGCGLAPHGPRSVPPHIEVGPPAPVDPGTEPGPGLEGRSPVAAAPSDGLSEDSERLLEHATLILEAIDAGSYTLAAQETQRMSAAFPGSRESWLIQVLLERRLAQLQSGASATLTASKQEAHARALIKQGRNEDARLLLERAHALDPANDGVAGALVSLLKQMGLERYGAGDAAQAAALWRRALEIKPDDEEARRFLKRADEVKEKM